ncbi:MAG: DUF3090 domain-containing protein [Actinomycetota bacterium]
MTSFDMDPVSRITVGAIGEPGSRTFFVQARKDDQLITLIAEKQQIQVLATTLTQLLEAMPPVEDEGDLVFDDDLELEQPLLPEWRIGPMRIEVDEARSMMVLIVEELVAEDDEGNPEHEPSEGRFVATRAQMRALGEHADAVCSAGRPRCQLCGFPLDPEGHACPATNGHRKLDS